MEKISNLIFLVLFSILLLNSAISFATLTNPIKEYNQFEEIGIRTNGILSSNATIISDGYGGLYWNTATSEEPSIAAASNGLVHVVWQDSTSGVWGSDYEIMYVYFDPDFGWSNVTVISDGYNGSYWNEGYSDDPAIAVDRQNNVHVVFADDTAGPWGIDNEIFYVNYAPDIGWSNITVISDGYGGSYWNYGDSYEPSIAIDSYDNIHVVWYDYSEGVWGNDMEIMYVMNTQSEGWSNVTVISDGYGGSYWNDGSSQYPSIVADVTDLHVVWYDETDGIWGDDIEIMYTKYTQSEGWSNATVISDGYGGSYWNIDNSLSPSIACNFGEIYVVWEDHTDGIWGTDSEIMYTKYLPTSGWSNATVISDGYGLRYWNDAQSTNPAIIVDYRNILHVIWQDYTDGIWGIDTEIMYINWTDAYGWTNVSIISDGYAGSYWNNDLSRNPAISSHYTNLYIVWQDATNGVWGTDDEIMCIHLNIPFAPLPQTIILLIPIGFHFLLGLLVAIIGLIYLTKRKL